MTDKPFFTESSNYVQITMYVALSFDLLMNTKINHSPRTIETQKDLDYKSLTNIFTLLFENSMVKLFSMVCHLSSHII